MKFLLSILDPEITVSFGGDGGIEEFKEYWQVHSKQSKLWDELMKVLSMGGTFYDKKKTQFAAPYVFATFPDELDAFECVVVTGKNVRLRAGPGLSYPVVTHLSYDILFYDDSPQGEWVEVRTMKGRFRKVGFVRTGWLGCQWSQANGPPARWSPR